MKNNMCKLFLRSKKQSNPAPAPKGFKTILFLYLSSQLGFSENFATMGVHFFIFWSYFNPLIGGTLADSLFGKFWTIGSLSLVYCVGQSVVSVSALPGAVGLPPQWW